MTGKSKILVVDDTSASLKLLTDMLKAGGYQVRSAISGALALQAAASDRPDLMLLDIRMPEMDGYEVCRRLKADPVTRDVPVIFVSAASEADEKVQGFGIGAVDYVTKPYQRDELLARVRTHLELNQLRNHLADRVAERTAELQESEKALRQSERKYRLLYDTTSDAVMMLDERGFIDCNGATLAMLGCATKDEFRTQSPSDFSPPKQPCGTDSEPLFRLRIASALAQGSLRFEWLYQRADNGKEFPAEVLLSAMDMDEKRILQASVRDISAQKEVENLLKETNETLAKRVQEELNELRKKDLLLIEQSRLASMGEMIGNIAHQWRQPLNILGLYFQNFRLDFQEGKLDEKNIEDYVSKAMHIVGAMSHTIDDFRKFLHPGGGKIVFDVRDTVVQAISLFEASYSYHGITLRNCLDCHSSQCNIWVRGVPNQFVQVLLNVLSNAKNVLTERDISEGMIEISCRCGERQVAIVIGDNGGGIAAEVLPKIFDPYFTTKATGTGLGLYMSRMIMDHMGGEINVHNGRNGAEFMIILPAALGKDVGLREDML